ncbi:probable carboxylesterase Os04g0669500 [Amborella trichopoda]|uniref:probable carboxylesterase Os04g0669500 n=1 Tax=Amborella trichopoda TaxID=13333 RepID=UPI0009BECFB6|nr:probable carboxylesterase Os04g0669500 [Amborella trichopoda]|eukprot:XP_020517452.1 probable carboxylesterase Os04g0669500 [Amborella trichopoda]
MGELQRLEDRRECGASEGEGQTRREQAERKQRDDRCRCFVVEMAAIVGRWKVGPFISIDPTIKYLGNYRSQESPKDEEGVVRAVRNVHAMIDKEVSAGISPENIFVCGFSQGSALTLASVLLYPKTLGGGTVFSGWVPFNSSILEKISLEAKRIFSSIYWSFFIKLSCGF